jgi:hypothetical protein
VNVLVDRHHAGLYRSLQLLGARLGWTLYTPVGTEWASERYWMFGQNRPGLTEELANQYLVPHEGVWTPMEAVGLEDVGHLWETYDPEFPFAPGNATRIHGVSLDRARGMKWDLMVATLDDNQWGFARFAREVGARFVMQVGNTGQFVDWRLDPLALVSSEVPIVGRGVRYHQEMDPAATAFVDPAEAWSDPFEVSSFVNCFPRIGPCYEIWREVRWAVLDAQFNVYGIDGTEGVLKPIARLHEQMGRSMFGYHDKVHGDGFGHVIHGWAAVGRPLIGHASHYRGKMAEHLWQHGVTAIDLDVVSIPEAARMVREIAADPARHEAMCRAIRAEYDRIDWDAETEDIRRLLA